MNADGGRGRTSRTGNRNRILFHATPKNDKHHFKIIIKLCAEFPPIFTFFVIRKIFLAKRKHKCKRQKKYFTLQEYKNSESPGSTTEEQCHSLTKNFVHVDG